MSPDRLGCPLGGSQVSHAFSTRVLVIPSWYHLFAHLLCEFLEGRTLCPLGLAQSSHDKCELTMVNI